MGFVVAADDLAKAQLDAVVSERGELGNKRKGTRIWPTAKRLEAPLVVHALRLLQPHSESWLESALTCLDVRVEKKHPQGSPVACKRQKERRSMCALAHDVYL